MLWVQSSSWLKLDELCGSGSRWLLVCAAVGDENQSVDVGSSRVVFLVPSDDYTV